MRPVKKMARPTVPILIGGRAGRFVLRFLIERA